MRFMAGQNYFSKIFGDSPVTPLQNHIDKVVACVEQLPPYFEAFLPTIGKKQLEFRMTSGISNTTPITLKMKSDCTYRPAFLCR